MTRCASFVEREHLEFHAISAATGEGVKELVRSIADALDKIPRLAPETAHALDAADDQMSDSPPVIPARVGRTRCACTAGKPRR